MVTLEKYNKERKLYKLILILCSHVVKETWKVLADWRLDESAQAACSDSNSRSMIRNAVTRYYTSYASNPNLPSKKSEQMQIQLPNLHLVRI